MILSLIGFFTVVFVVFNLGRQLYARFIAEPYDWKIYKDKDSYALITGSSGGIGFGYAVGLAKRGINVILLARSQDKLQANCKELTDKFKIKAEYIQFDAINGDYEDLKKKMDEYNINILINNVGGMSKMLTFAEKTSDQLLHTLNLNLKAPIIITNHLLPKMIKNNQGAIMNISSVTSRQAAPQLNIYGSTKRMLNSFNNLLAVEVRNTNIVVQSILPGDVHTNLNKSKIGILCPSAVDFCEVSLKRFGVLMEMMPYDTHWLVHGVVFGLLPEYYRHLLIANVIDGRINRVKARKAKKLAEESKKDK